jgi:hypothetical protein
MTKHYSKTIFPAAWTLIFILLSQSVFSQTNWFKTGSAPKQYENFIDSINQHDGKNVMTLKSVEASIDGFGTLMQNMKPGKYLDKRVRMTGYLKSKDVTDWAGFWFRVDQADSQQPLPFDNMQNRQIKGTTDWKKYEIVLDVPGSASNIAFGALLSGTGQIWIENVNFEIVDNSVPTTGLKMQE